MNEIGAFDPDEFVINKRDILDILDAIEIRWRGDTIMQSAKNIKYLACLELTKGAIGWTNEEVIKLIWHDLIFAINEMMRLNAMNRMSKEFMQNNPNAKHNTIEEMKQIVIAKMKSGELFAKSNYQKNREKKK